MTTVPPRIDGAEPEPVAHTSGHPKPADGRSGAFAARARELCPESDEHHDRVIFCTTCHLIARRLQPVHETLRDVLDDAGLTIQFDWRRA